MFGVKPYPEKEERATMNAAFDHLFATIKHQDLHSKPGTMPKRAKGQIKIHSDAEKGPDPQSEADDEETQQMSLMGWDDDYYSPSEDPEWTAEVIAMSQSESEQSGRWITIGGHEGSGDKGGCKVFIGRGGRILKGPAGLKGENLKTLGDKDSKESREARAAHARAQCKTGHDLTEQEARKLGSKAHVTAHAHAKDEARMAGVSTHDVLQNMPEAHKYRLEQHGQREHAKTRARQMTGMNAGNLAKFENTYKDYSTVTGFDTAARTIAMEHPELGLDPDGDETAPAVWELIREGKVEEPKLHDRETARQAAEWINQARRHHKVATKHDPVEDTSFNFGFGHDELGDGETPFIDFSQNTDGDQ